MKNLIKPGSFKYAYLLIALMVTNVIAWAQDSTVTATSTTTTKSQTQTWYAEPWVWGVGGVVLILLIVALTRGGGNTDKVIITKTSTTDKD